MLSILLILIVLVGALALVKAAGSANRAAEEAGSEMPYLKREHLFNETERLYYKTLSQVVQGGNYSVFVKVPLLDLLELPRSTSNWITHWNRVSSKYMDFVVCDKENFKPLAAIKLDGVSPGNAGDSFLDKVFDHVGLPYLKVQAGDLDDPAEVSRQLGQILNLRTSAAGSESD